MPKLPIRAVFANRLRAARTALGVSQAELGARVGIPEDVASTRVNRYERGVHEPDLATAEALADELGIPLPALIARDDGMAMLIAGSGPEFERPRCQHFYGRISNSQAIGKRAKSLPRLLVGGVGNQTLNLP